MKESGVKLLYSLGPSCKVSLEVYLTLESLRTAGLKLDEGVNKAHNVTPSRLCCSSCIWMDVILNRWITAMQAPWATLLGNSTASPELKDDWDGDQEQENNLIVELCCLAASEFTHAPVSTPLPFSCCEKWESSSKHVHIRHEKQKGSSECDWTKFLNGLSLALPLHADCSQL